MVEVSGAEETTIAPVSRPGIIPIGPAQGGSPVPSPVMVAMNKPNPTSNQTGTQTCMANAHGVQNDLPTRAPTRPGAYGVLPGGQDLGNVNVIHLVFRQQ